jgi:hypothetical protein
MTSCGIRYISKLRANPPNVSLYRRKTHISEISLWCQWFESITMFLTLQWTFTVLCKSIFYPLITTEPHMKNYSNINIYGISKEWLLFILNSQDRKVYFEKKEIVRTFGIKRKQLEIYLRRHKDSIPVIQYINEKQKENKKTLVHISILPYLIRCLLDEKKPREES